MAASQNNDGFTETTDMPRGRKARAVPAIVEAKLEESARRQVAFTKSGTPDEIDQLRRDLGAASVRAKYEVTVSTDKTGKAHKLTFAAKTREQAQADAEAAEPATADA